jgi:hypothetical protein
MFFLEFRITSLLQSKSTLLLSGSVALIGQSLVLHNYVIIDISIRTDRLAGIELHPPNPLRRKVIEYAPLLSTLNL